LADSSERIDEASLAKIKLANCSGGPFFPSPECWEIEIQTLMSVEDLEQHPVETEEYSLLLYSGSDQKFSDVACWFAGPVLNLSDCRSSFLHREIVAAVEAMS
jgi:hypothetical protein